MGRQGKSAAAHTKRASAEARAASAAETLTGTVIRALGEEWKLATGHGSEQGLEVELDLIGQNHAGASKPP